LVLLAVFLSFACLTRLRCVKCPHCRQLSYTVEHHRMVTVVCNSCGLVLRGGWFGQKLLPLESSDHNAQQ
jgi:ribosomal protein S27E